MEFIRFLRVLAALLIVLAMSYNSLISPMRYEDRVAGWLSQDLDHRQPELSADGPIYRHYSSPGDPPKVRWEVEREVTSETYRLEEITECVGFLGDTYTGMILPGEDYVMRTQLDRMPGFICYRLGYQMVPKYQDP